MSKKKVVLANFGGPRTPDEIRPFLTALLTDRDVLRTSLPRPIEWLLFRRVARRRTGRVTHDYAQIGGASPIVETTETLAKTLSEQLDLEVIPFHRYVLATHDAFFKQLEGTDAITVFPLFPQFSYTTSGSIARLFAKKLHVPHIEWIVSYPLHPAYLKASTAIIRQALKDASFDEDKTLLLFTPHGLPQSYVDEGDPYAAECTQSFNALASAFPHAKSLLAYQSRFGKEEWLRPYTDETCHTLHTHKRQNVLFIPLSFTMDHLETLFEIQTLYLPLATAQGLNAARCPALNLDPTWITAIGTILADGRRAPNHALIR